MALHPLRGAESAGHGRRCGAGDGSGVLKRGRLHKPAVARTLFGHSGPITPHLLKRSVQAEANYLLIEVAGQTWLAAVPPGQDAEARQFATWINQVSEHYRYR